MDTKTQENKKRVEVRKEAGAVNSYSILIDGEPILINAGTLVEATEKAKRYEMALAKEKENEF